MWERQSRSQRDQDTKREIDTDDERITGNGLGEGGGRAVAEAVRGLTQLQTLYLGSKSQRETETERGAEER